MQYDQDKRIKKHCFKPLAVFSKIILVTAFLAACNASIFNLNQNSARISGSQNIPYSGDMQQAYCEGRLSDIIDLLATEPLTAPADRFFLALSLESSGYALAARRIYEDLASNGVQGAEGIDISCGNHQIALGDITELALTRMADLDLRLTKLDVRPDPEIRLHAGLAGNTPETTVSQTELPSPEKKPQDKNTGKSGVSTITLPDSASNSGLFFAHLASYRAIDNATQGVEILAKLYPALRGFITLWETEASGSPVWRIGVRTIDFSDAEKLCEALAETKSYCRVLDTAR